MLLWKARLCWSLCCLKNPLMIEILMECFVFCLNIDCYLTPHVDHFGKLAQKKSLAVLDV